MYVLSDPTHDGCRLFVQQPVLYTYVSGMSPNLQSRIGPATQHAVPADFAAGAEQQRRQKHV